MKMRKFEKLFVNRPRRTRRVADHAEKMLRLAGFVPGQSYLDFGCGNGATAFSLASKLGLNVTGIDVDPDQIEAAKARSKGHANPRFLALDGTRLPFGDGEFDFVATHMVTHHIPNWAEALLQMVRVLRLGGCLIYKDLVLPRWAASVGKKVVKGMGFPTADELGRFARENNMVAIHRVRTFNKYEAVWQKGAD